MRIGEIAEKPAAGVREWVCAIRGLPDAEFLQQLQLVAQWPWGRLEDLSPVAPILDRIDSLLLPSLKECNYSLLDLLLDKSALLLCNASSKALYNSLAEVLLVLDCRHWSTLYKALGVIHLLVSRAGDNVGPSKAHKHPELAGKLYVLAFGNYLNNSNPVPLAAFCQHREIAPLGFQYMKGNQLLHSQDEPPEALPEKLRYVYLNRQRTNAALGDFSVRALAVACQLLGLSCFLQASPPAQLMQEFAKSMPELWLLPNLAELLSLQTLHTVHSEVVNVLAAVCLIGGSSTRGQPASPLLEAVYNLLGSGQEHGLLHRLIRDVCLGTAEVLPCGSAAAQPVLDSVLHLASVIADFKFRMDPSHVPAMTMACLELLKVPVQQFSLKSMAKAASILSLLISHSNATYRELEGTQQVIGLLIYELKVLTQQVECAPATENGHMTLARELFKLLQTALAKNEPNSPVQSKIVLDSELVPLLKQCFERNLFEIYDVALQVMHTVLLDSPNAVAELCHGRFLAALFDSFDKLRHPSVRIVSSTSRFLCAIAVHQEGSNYIMLYNVVNSLLQCIGNIDSVQLTNDFTMRIGESFQELMNITPKLKDKVVAGCIGMLKAMYNFSPANKAQFFSSLAFAGKLLSMIFSYASDLVKGFMDKGGLEAFLGLFKLQTLPIAQTNEFHAVINSFKHIHQNSASLALSKVFAEISLQVTALERLVGPLKTLEDFAQVPTESKDQLFYVLRSIDSFAEMSQHVLVNGVAITNNIIELSRVVHQLSEYFRVLIAEQARLSPVSHPDTRTVEQFNIPISVQDIENTSAKSFEENFYLNCQLTLKRVFRLLAKVPGMRGRQSVPEEIGVKLSKTMGEVLCTLARRLRLDVVDAQSAYRDCLLFSELLKILLSAQGASAATVYMFYQAGGLGAISSFVLSLKSLSAQLYFSESLPYHLVNCLQILWNLSGRFFKDIVNGKYASSTGGSSIIKSLGMESSKEIVKKLKEACLEQITQLKFLECGVYSAAFAQAILEIILVLSELNNEAFVDPRTIEKVVEMGFSEYAARQAILNVGTSSVEMATEWIFAHPEVLESAPEEQEPAMDLTNMHSLLINALPGIPSLHASVSDILVKICNRPSAPYTEVGLMLLSLIGALSNEVLKDSSLMETTALMASVEPLQIPATAQQLTAALEVLAALCLKYPESEIMEILQENGFSGYLCQFLATAGQGGARSLEWVGPVFSLLECLVRSDPKLCPHVIDSVAALIHFNHSQEASSLRPPQLLSLLQLLVVITYDPCHSQAFLSTNSVLPLVVVKLKEAASPSKAIITSYSTLMKQLVEDPTMLQQVYEGILFEALQVPQPLEPFIKKFKQQAARSDVTFKRAFANAAVTLRQGNSIVVKRNSERVALPVEHTEIIPTLANCLSEIYSIEQQGEVKSYLSSENLLVIFAELLQAHPVLIAKLIEHSVQAFDVLSGVTCTQPFIRHLLRNIIPFRYTIHPSDYIITYTLPHSEAAVSSETYQNWIKPASRFIRALVFKQCIKDSAMAAHHHAAISKARKLVFGELQGLLREHTIAPLVDAKDISIVRTVVILTMQVLRESGKSPYLPNNPPEIAKLLLSEKLSFVPLLAESAKCVNLHLKRANTFLNIILAPIELLLRYNINFVLKATKERQGAEDNVIQAIEEDSNENQQLEEELPEEDDEREEHSELLDDEEQINEMILESRNTEAFWADNIEEDEGYYPHSSQRRHFQLDRLQEDPGIDILNENEEGAIDMQRHLLESGVLLRGAQRDMGDHFQMIQLLREMGSHNEEFLHFFTQNRMHREVPEPRPIRPQPVNYNFDNMIIELAEGATEPPVQEPEHNPVEVPEAELREEPREEDLVPEGVDPEVFNELPEDIRRELLGQYRPPPNNSENIASEVFEALPSDIRDELLQPNHPPPQAEELDIANFVATLAPDLRRDVLVSLGDEAISALPPDMAAEARMLQEQFARPNYLAERAYGRMGRKPPVDEHREVAEIVADEKAANSLMQFDDSVLEGLLKALYIINPVNKEILASLLLSISAQPLNRQKLLDGLVCLLLQLTPHEDFPQQHLLGSESFLENYPQVYAIVSSKILEFLRHLALYNPQSAVDLTRITGHRLPAIRTLRGGEDIFAFRHLISLLGQSLFRSSSAHLAALIGLLSVIAEKQAANVPALDEDAILHICGLLSYQSLNEGTVSTVVSLVKVLANHEGNRQQIERTLTIETEVIAQGIAETLRDHETSSTGQAEVKLLRLAKMLKSVNGAPNLHCLWQPLTDAVQLLTETDTELLGATNPTLSKLLPLIETFFVSFTNSEQTEEFHQFCEKNKKALNTLVKQSPNLLNETFSALVTSFAGLLDFENKKLYFHEEMRQLLQNRHIDNVRLSVRRNWVFIDSYNQLKVRSGDDLLGRLCVQFREEEGMDAGGLTREWYSILAREMFNPNYALFLPSASGVTFQPNSMSGVNSDSHLLYFKFVGRVIGKAIFDNNPLDVYFTRSFYKHILGQEITYQDMEDLDPDFYKSLKALFDLNLDENDLHEYYFVYEEEEFGRMTVKELMPGGKTVRVTQANKKEYVSLLCHMKMTNNIQAQIKAFLEGFYELIPKRVIAIFDAKELELLISGLPEIHLSDLKANTDYHNYNEDSQVIKHFWEVLTDFSSEERAEFIQFVTGSSKVPLEGFKALPGIGGIQRFQIHKSFTDISRLPTAHTCMNQLDLPEYPSKELLYKRLKYAITEGKESFGFV